MLKVGITGGIGSGKTTVCKVFEVLNVPVYYSDLRSKEIMTTVQALKIDLESTFGKDTFDSEGNLKTAYLASIVFRDQKKLNLLNSIVHPYVLEDFRTWCKMYNNKKYIILESAIIYESGIENLLDYIILVDAPYDIRMKRIIERDKLTVEEVAQRMSRQLSSEEKNNLSKLILINDGKTSVIDQILSFHKTFSDH